MKNRLSDTFRRSFLLIALLSFGLILSACQPNQSTQPEDESLLVTVSIPPLAYFVERIGGDQVEVNTMVGPGEEAHTYEPKPDQMKALSDSPIFFSIGIEYEESWVPRFMDINPDLLVVDSAQGIERIESLSEHSHDEEEEEETDEHDADNLDPHVWLSPQNGKIIAKNIFNALKSLSPEDEQTFIQNYNALVAEIDLLDEQILQTLSETTYRIFMVFHPAWGYFADQYNLQQIAVQVGGQDPSPSELVDLINIAKAENIHVIFIQPTFSTTSVNALSKEIDAEIIAVDPLAENWLENLKIVADAFAAALTIQP
jgi:zinc transport system substrate-binding protein